MKFIIDKMPNPDECIFSKWEVYPPFMELTGEWYCVIDKKICNIDQNQCRWLKEQEQDEGKIF